jgi:hypothetical protein
MATAIDSAPSMSMTDMSVPHTVGICPLTPLPSVHAPDALHVLQHGCSERSAEDVSACQPCYARSNAPIDHSRQSLRTVPERHPERQLLSHIPRRGHQSDGGQERSFGEADGETSASETGRGLDDGEEDGGHRPPEPESEPAAPGQPRSTYIMRGMTIRGLYLDSKSAPGTWVIMYPA